MADTVRKRPGAVAMLPVTKLVTLCQDHFAQPKEGCRPIAAGVGQTGPCVVWTGGSGMDEMPRLYVVPSLFPPSIFCSERREPPALVPLAPRPCVRGNATPPRPPCQGLGGTRKRVGASDNSDGLEGSAASLMTTGCTRSRAG